MYNTNFIVKYNDIEKELLHKLETKTEADDKKEIYDGYQYYTSEDVLDICYKLYIDELVSVFDAEDIIDDKIDIGMKYIMEIMCENMVFNELMNELVNITIKLFLKDEEINEEKMSEMKHLMVLLFFSQNVFYIMHKCICQQLTMDNIEEDLLLQLKEQMTAVLKKHYSDFGVV